MRNVDLFDDYLFDRLNPSQKSEFETRLQNDEELNKEFKLHKFFIESIQYAAGKNELKAKLNTIHTDAFGKNNIVSIQHKTNYFKIVAIAASVSLLVFVGGALLFSSDIFGKKESAYEEVLGNVNKRVAADLQNIKSKKSNKVYAPANIEASGFAISTKGYFLTSLHAVKNSDSVMVQNESLDYVAAERVWEDANLDVAIYKLKNTADFKFTEVPILFRNTDLDLGEKVFALGYPRETIVYSEGNISAATGLYGDTTKYQLSLMVNPGNSGSPVLDEQGNLVGIISGRNHGAQGVSYAVKAQYIFDMIKNIPDQKLKNEILVNGKNSIKKLKRTEQIKKLKPFIYNIMVYKSQTGE